MKFNPNYKNRFRILKGGKISLVVSALLGSCVISFAAPSGGVVTSGNANISQNGKITNINQSTQKASINWNQFNVAHDEIVNFKQPDINSITLNRVIGNEKSVINGALNANGQVWLLNSNGVLFGKGAKINTAGLLATTKELSDTDFQAGNYNFKGNSTASVINLGEIDISNSGYATLLANTVTNEGTIKAVKGSVRLVGANEVTINLNGNSIMELTVNKGVLDALVENKGAIYADGGEIYLTTNAVDELLKGVVNNTGIIEANSVDGITGYVELFAHGGTANVAGTINATDGFVETSGRKIEISDDFAIKAANWLIDPYNVYIERDSEESYANDGQNYIGNEDDTIIKASTIETALSSASVTIKTTNSASSGNQEGNIYVNSSISWNTDSKLTLDAYNDIFINKEITSSHANGKLELLYGQKAAASGNTADYHVNAKVNLHAGSNFLTKLGNDAGVNATPWTVVTDAATMQAMTINDINARYVLGTDLTLSGTNNWTAISNFYGKFDGLGHTISNLHIDKADTNFQGLFGKIENATIQNIGLVNATVSGDSLVGTLVGKSTNSIISNTYAIGGSVTGKNYNVGGLVGQNYADSATASISNSYSTNSVTGNNSVGGLVGFNTAKSMMESATASITNSYATGSVTGVVYNGNNPSDIGGLVGFNTAESMMDSATASITNSYASNSVTSTGSYVGGLVGKVEEDGGTSIITSSFYDNQTNTATMQDSVALGKTKSDILNLVGNSWESSIWGTDGSEVSGYATGTIDLPFLKGTTKFQNTLFESGFGTTNDAYTITNWTQLQNINYGWNTKNKNYTLLNNISSATAGYIGTGEGWNPIGVFSGNFDGLGHSISDLYTNRSANNQGLFGQTEDASIVNVNLTNVDIKGQNKVGGLVGNATITHIENVSTSGKVVGNNEVGGLVGYIINAKDTILKSHSSAQVTGANDVGGLVGNLNYDSAIRQSYATGEVTGDGSNIGGLVGNSNYSTIENSYATGTVNGLSTKGGLIGNSENDQITNSYATGEVVGIAPSFGGLIGSEDGTTVSDSFFNTETTKQTKGIGNSATATGVTAKTTAELKDKTTFADWNIQEDSTIVPSTPFLAWQ
ncbi:MAG: GLUG motif-containing protein, partial [Arcobacteraceae bacterium]